MKIDEKFFLEELKDSSVLISTKDNYYFILNDVASFIWKKLKEGKEKNEIIASLCQEFEVEKDLAISDYDKFIERLKNDGIITL